MQRKWIILTGILLLALAAIGGYYFYQKPRASLTNARADYSVTTTELYNAFAANETTANTKYLNKVIEVNGEVADVKYEDGATAVLLKGSDVGGVNCSLQSKGKLNISAGQNVKIKGRCTGYLMDVNLVDAIIIEP